MIYLIGGAPRVGKTRLVEQVVGLRPMHAISTDAIRYMLRHGVPKSVLSSDLFLSSEKDIQAQQIENILADQNAESVALWPYIIRFLESYNYDGYDLLVEGVAVLPSLLSTLEIPHRSLIIGNSSPSHGDTIVTHSRQNANDWLNAYTPDQVASYIKFFEFMNNWLKQEATHHAVAYAKIDDNSFDVDIKAAAMQLLG